MPKEDYQPNVGQGETPAPEPEPAPEEMVDLKREDQADEASYAAEIAELNERILRLAAELENTRRRAEREKAEAGRYAITSFARDLLTVADTFERALQSAPGEGDTIAPETVTALVTGLRMTDKELLTVLERHGVKRIAPTGEKFDPNLHQAVAQAPGAAPAGHVEAVAQPGFVIGDRVLRAAMVIVSTGGGKADGDGADNPPGARVDTSA